MRIKALLAAVASRIRRRLTGRDFIAPKTDPRGNMLTTRIFTVPSDGTVDRR
jgi:hypothetical protein